MECGGSRLEGRYVDSLGGRVELGCEDREVGRADPRTVIAMTALTWSEVRDLLDVADCDTVAALIVKLQAYQDGVRPLPDR